MSDHAPLSLKLLLSCCCLLLLPGLAGQEVPDSSLLRSYRHKSLDRIEKSLYDPFSRPDIYGKPPSEAAWGGPDALLQTTGSLSRGITVGNGRDLSMDSYLNLQVQGMLSDRLSISAHISDRNVPLQSAASMQWKEFDRIFIRLDYLSPNESRIRLTAGDVDLKDAGTHFLRFSRQGLGMHFRWVRDDTASADKRRTLISLTEAVAKGTFRRQQLTAREGVQGAYRLTGANGEARIMILSASEKVYIDGVLMKRGEDADYVIDYALAEITFTARQPITRDKRIVVEFEYSDLNYVRSHTHLQAEQRRNNWQYAFDFYNEQDLKYQSNILQGDAGAIAFLQHAEGGGPYPYPYADSVGYISGEVLYLRTDTLVGGVLYDSVYVYSTDRDRACYRLRFTYVGEGKGNYVAVQNSVNGQVYAWVAPQEGVPQGGYEPCMQLVAPGRRQVYSFRTGYSGGKVAFFAESAISNSDANTFSGYNTPERGVAFRSRLQTGLKWGGGKRPWRLTPTIGYEGKGGGFAPVDAWRDVEFARSYNLSDSLTAHRGEHYADFTLLLESPLENRMQWQTTAYLIPASGWQAVRHGLMLRERIRGWHADADASWLLTRTADYRSSFLRHREVADRKLLFLKLGLTEEMEWNRYWSLPYDTLMRLSRGYNEWSVFLCPSDSAGKWLNYRLEFSQRRDYSPFGNSLRSSSDAWQFRAEAELLKFRHHPLRASFSCRSLQSVDSLWVPMDGQRTLLGDLDYRGRFANGAVQAGLHLALGAEMEQKTDFTYIKVPPGQGVYQWIDYNGNGVEEWDEFETAVYRDQADYIRVSLVSNELEKVYATTWTQSLALRPEAVWGRSTGLRRWLTRFTNSTSFQSGLKKGAAAVEAAEHPVAVLFDPLVRDLADSALHSGQFQFRNLLSYRPNHPRYGAEWLYRQQKNKYLTVNGSEHSLSESGQLSFRYRPGESLQLRLSYTRGLQASASEWSDARDYRLLGEHTLFSMQYPASRRLHLTLSYSYRWQRNDFGEERLFSNSVEGEAVLRMPGQGSLNARLRYVHIRFNGNEGTPVGYVMMEALSNGANGIANIAYQTRLGENLQLDLAYEGRLSESGLKNTGTLTVKAVF